MSTTFDTIVVRETTSSGLSVTRLNVMRVGYLLMTVGLAATRWPRLAEVHTLTRYEGITVVMLTAMSLLAILGLRYPVKLMPLLLFESAWKLLWLGLVALPKILADDLDPGSAETLVNCSLVVVILAVTPWRHVWQHYLRATGDPWR